MVQFKINLRKEFMESNDISPEESEHEGTFSPENRLSLTMDLKVAVVPGGVALIDDKGHEIEGSKHRNLLLLILDRHLRTAFNLAGAYAEIYTIRHLGGREFITGSSSGDVSVIITPDSQKIKSYEALIFDVLGTLVEVMKRMGGTIGITIQREKLPHKVNILFMIPQDEYYELERNFKARRLNLWTAFELINPANYAPSSDLNTAINAPEHSKTPFIIKINFQSYLDIYRKSR